MVLRALATGAAGLFGAAAGGPVGGAFAAGMVFWLFSEGYIVLYHHTDIDSAESIARCGEIYQSQTNGPRVDAAFGDGTYLTTLGPSASKSTVAANNYDGYYVHRLHKTMVAIEVRVHKSKVKQCKSSRNIYLYRGDLKLKDVQHVLFHVRNLNGGSTTYTLKQF